MYDLMSLMDQHDRLDALADQLIARARVHASPASDCRGLMEQMAAILHSHLAAEAEFLYANTDADNDNDLAATIADFEQHFAMLDEHWREFLIQWSVPRIEGNRAAFQSQASDIMTALKLRIARENMVLYPLALEKGRISLRPGA